MILQSIIHSETNSGMLATGYNSKMISLLNSGENVDLDLWENHLGREWFKRLHNEGLSSYITDNYDASFRPVSITGLFSS